jgi:hypothetical protein
MKIELDKYYTPIEIANHCFEKTIELVGADNITEIIEPSVGNGSFLHHQFTKERPMLCIDLEPEIFGDNIIKSDWLTYPIDYKKGRLVIGNPPYGSRMNLAQKFFKKSVRIGDYVAFILPISQLSNTQSLFEFDLIYSEDLGTFEYSGVPLHCCFNVYKRPNNGELNKKQTNRLPFVKICRNDSKGFSDFVYDLRVCAWGDGTAGKILSEDEHYSAEYKIKVDDNHPLHNEIVDYLKNFNWREFLNCIAMRKIQQFHIINILTEHFNF